MNTNLARWSIVSNVYKLSPEINYDFLLQITLMYHTGSGTFVNVHSTNTMTDPLILFISVHVESRYACNQLVKGRQAHNHTDLTYNLVKSNERLYSVLVHREEFIHGAMFSICSPYLQVLELSLLLLQRAFEFWLSYDLWLRVVHPLHQLVKVLVKWWPLHAAALQGALGVVQRVVEAFPAVAHVSQLAADLLASLIGRVGVELFAWLQGRIEQCQALFLVCQEILRREKKIKYL